MPGVLSSLLQELQSSGLTVDDSLFNGLSRLRTQFREIKDPAAELAELPDFSKNRKYDPGSDSLVTAKGDSGEGKKGMAPLEDSGAVKANSPQAHLVTAVHEEPEQEDYSDFFNQIMDGDSKGQAPSPGPHDDMDYTAKRVKVHRGHDSKYYIKLGLISGLWSYISYRLGRYLCDTCCNRVSNSSMPRNDDFMDTASLTSGENAVTEPSRPWLYFADVLSSGETTARVTNEASSEQEPWKLGTTASSSSESTKRVRGKLARYSTESLNVEPASSVLSQTSKESKQGYSDLLSTRSVVASDLLSTRSVVDVTSNLSAPLNTERSSEMLDSDTPLNTERSSEMESSN